MAKTLKAKHLTELRYLSQPTFSPDGQLIVVVEAQAVLADPPYYQSQLVVYDLAGNRRPLTHSGTGYSAPQFSPDGRYLAYLVRREPKAPAQLAILPLAGGEPQPLTEHSAGVSAFCWQPDSAGLIYLSRGETPEERGEPRVIDRRRYRFDGVGFLPSAPPTLYRYQLARQKAHKLIELEADASDFSVSADGKTLYFISADAAQHEVFLRMPFALSLKSCKLRPLLKAPGRISALSVSPGGQLAFLAPSRWQLFASPTGLWTASGPSWVPRLHTGELEITVGDGVAGDSRYGPAAGKPRWLDEGALLVTVNRAGKNELARLELESGELVEVVAGERVVTGFSVCGERIAFIAETPDRPGELYLAEGGAERRLSACNDAFVARFQPLDPGPPTTCRAADGTELSYWRLNPRKPRKDKAVVLEVHGGPHTNYGYGFMFEFQLLAAAGFTVIYGNPRGSSSFGDAFATAILGRYGSVDAEDLLAMLEHALAGETPPVHLTGGSYGGFMTNWLIAHSDRFRSAVTQRSICNWLSFFGTSDIGYDFTPVEQGGNPWQDTEKLWAQSPLKYVANIHTPLLIVHSEADYRCPIEQAEQLYMALKCLGREVRLMRFPDEGHELSRSGRPDRRIARLEAIVAWFKAH